MNKKIFLGLLIVIMIVTMITGFALASENITLTFWKPSWGTADEKYLPPLFEKFEESHPGVKIEFLFHPWEGLMERYVLAFSGPNPPDIFYMPDLQYPKLAAAGFLAKLDQEFPDDINKVKAENIDTWWNPGNYKGNQYGFPFVHVGISLVYNKDMFDKAGVAYPPSVNDANLSEWTWDKFIEVCTKLTDPANNKWGYAWAANYTGDTEVMVWPHLVQAGATILDPNDPTKTGLDSPAGLVGYNFINDLVNKYNIAPDKGMNPKFQDMFYTGNAAICPFDCHGIKPILEQHPELRIGVTTMPKGPGTNLDGRGMHANVGFLFLSEKSQNKEMAWELIKFLASKENVETYINDVGLFGCRKDYEMKIEDPVAQDLLDQVLTMSTKYGYAYDINPKLIELRDIATAEIQNMITKSKTPEQALKDTVDHLNSILSQ